MVLVAWDKYDCVVLAGWSITLPGTIIRLPYDPLSTRIEISSVRYFSSTILSETPLTVEGDGILQKVGYFEMMINLPWNFELFVEH